MLMLIYQGHLWILEGGSWGQLLVVVCGHYASPTSTYMSFIYGEPSCKKFTDQTLTQLKENFLYL
jgi:hypothetical protein